MLQEAWVHAGSLCSDGPIPGPSSRGQCHLLPLRPTEMEPSSAVGSAANGGERTRLGYSSVNALWDVGILKT